MGQTVDYLARCMLAISMRHLHWHTHSVNVNITLDYVCHLWLRPLGLPHAKPVPTLPHALHWCNCVQPVDNSRGLHYCGAPVDNFCGLWITWGRGAKVAFVIIIVPTQVY